MPQPAPALRPDPFGIPKPGKLTAAFSPQPCGPAGFWQ